MEVTVCKDICDECAFNGNSKDTLYADMFQIVLEGKVFPCHKYLKSKTGCKYLGVEQLNEVKVCRGYVAFVKKYNPHIERLNQVWKELIKDIKDDELNNILSLRELVDNHIGLRDKIFLGN